MTDLNRTLVDIAVSTGHLEISAVGFSKLLSEALQRPPGPNKWDEMQPEDFGPQHDFDIEDHGSIVVFDCDSRAALHWCYKHLPDDCPRWGGTGFAIEHRFIGPIIEGARRDGLMSRQDYEEAMNAEERDRYAGEDS